MSVDPKDREAYEEGARVHELGIVDRILYDFVDMMPVGSIRSESENAAFEKGKWGEQLDEDKKD